MNILIGTVSHQLSINKHQWLIYLWRDNLNLHIFIKLKILQARLQQYVNHELPDVHAGFRKGRVTRDRIAKIRWIIEKATVLEKHLLLLCWLSQSLWLCGSQQIVENSSRDGITRAPDLPLRNLCAGQEATDRTRDRKQTGSKLGKECIKVVYCHPAYLTYIQSTSCKMPDCIMHKLQSRWQGEILITSHMQMTPPLWQKVKRN